MECQFDTVVLGAGPAGEVAAGRLASGGERRVRVGEDVLVADNAVVIAVGSSALFPPIPGLAEVGTGRTES